ncbi:MAG: glycosyltransferase, partial [Candidatus Thorarchaeota archaeon]
ADRVTTVADFLRKMAIEKLGVEREIEVIPNFIDPKVFRRTSRVELVVEDGCPVMRERRDHTVSRKDRILLHVSNFRRVKRVVELIDAMRLVVDNVPEARLLLVGDGPTRTEVERRIEQHRLCNRVHLIGVRTNVNELMSSADLFVLNSNLEGMPLVLLEAMACELPVVTTPAGGVPELVRPGIDGIVTETFETEELAEGVIRLLTDDRLRARLGKAGRRRVLDGFTPEVIVPRYEKVLRSALNG